MHQSDFINEYIKNKKRNECLNIVFYQAAWNWIYYNIGIWNKDIPTADQIGKAYISNGGEELGWEYSWSFTSDYSHIRITYNTIKNEDLDINEDTEVILSFEEFAKYV